MLLHRLDRRRRPPGEQGEGRRHPPGTRRRVTPLGAPGGRLLARPGRGLPVLGYVMRIRAELGDPFTYEVYVDARNDRGQRIWVHREASLNAAVAWMMQRAGELVAFARERDVDGRPTPEVDGR
ncbi:hypothetical protein [Clavibacter tessellarius]|uniref:hypothetical protein n=1 Tax=Clavibacter tessellarius TaxID=31965 RepID=UPI003251D466